MSSVVNKFGGAHCDIPCSNKIQYYLKIG